MHPGVLERLESGRLFVVDTGLSWTRWFNWTRMVLENPKSSHRRVVVYAIATSAGLLGRVVFWRNPKGVPAKDCPVRAVFAHHKRMPVTQASVGGSLWSWRTRQTFGGGDRLTTSLVGPGRTVLDETVWVISPGESYGFELMAVGVGGLTAYLFEDGE